MTGRDDSAWVGDMLREYGTHPAGATCRQPGCGHRCTIGEQVLSDCLERVGRVQGGPYCPAHLPEGSE